MLIYLICLQICVPKVPALPPPLTLQSSTTTMSFSSYNEDSDEEDEDEDSDEEGEEGEEESSCDEEEVTSEESDNESNRKDVVGMKSDTCGGGIKKKQFIQPTIIAPTASSPSTSPSLHNQVIETLPEMVSGFFWSNLAIHITLANLATPAILATLGTFNYKVEP